MRLTFVIMACMLSALTVAGTSVALVETIGTVANAPNDPVGTAENLAADGQAKAGAAAAIATGAAGNAQAQGNAAAALAGSVVTQATDGLAWCMALQCSPLWPVYELLGQVGPLVADPGAAVCAQPLADGSPVHLTVGAAGQEAGASASVQACEA
jgi:hypothetical protein